MNAKENSFNNIQIFNYISEVLNLKPENDKTGYALFKCPFRKEANASFKVDKNKNLWYDYGTGTGGTFVDFFMQLHQCDYKTAVSKLTNENQLSFSFHSNDTPAETPATIEIKHIQTLQNRALIQYLSVRKIPLKIAKIFLSEIYYTTNGNSKQFFGLAFKNDLNGFEIRNKYFKGCTGHKAITTVKGENTGVLNIFEGFFDFLSALVYFQTDKPTHDTIILNSTSQTQQTENILNNYKKINLFLDNDNAGKTTAQFFLNRREKVENMSEKLYPDYKDFNDFLCKKKAH